MPCPRSSAARKATAARAGRVPNDCQMGACRRRRLGLLARGRLRASRFVLCFRTLTRGMTQVFSSNIAERRFRPLSYFVQTTRNVHSFTQRSSCFRLLSLVLFSGDQQRLVETSLRSRARTSLRRSPLFQPRMQCTNRCHFWNIYIFGRRYVIIRWKLITLGR